MMSPNSFLNLLKKHKLLFLSFVFFLIFSITVKVLATFAPGVTLNPGCVPESDGCTVDVQPLLTFSTGLTNSSNTVTDNLSTGVSGGQSVVGGTASGDNLTLSSTSHATKGKIFFGTSAYDEVNNRLGIGNTGPTNPLSVTGNSDISGILTVPSLIGSTASGGTLTVSSTSHATKGKILFGTSAYDEVNNVLGIGTTIPNSTAQLNIVSNSAPQIYLDGYGTSSPASVIGRRANGTIASPTKITNAQRLLILGGYGYHDGTPGFTSVSPNPAIEFKAQTSAGWSNTSQGSLIDFYTTPDLSTTRALVLELTANGNVGVSNKLGAGFTGSAISYTGDFRSNVADYSVSIFNDGNTTTRSGLLIQGGLDDQSQAGPSTLIGFKDGDGDAVGSITFGSSQTNYNTTSDQRLKENIVDTSLGLPDLMNIKIRDFNWKNDKDKKLTHGVIAQELEQVYPGAVTVPSQDNLDGLWQVDYSKLTPLIIKSIQDQQKEITDLQLKIPGYQFNLTESSSIASQLRDFLSKTADKTINGIVSIKEAIADKFTTKQLCLEDVCITKTELLALLSKNGISSSNGVSIASVNNVQETPTPSNPPVVIPTVDIISTTTVTNENQIVTQNSVDNVSVSLTPTSNIATSDSVENSPQSSVSNEDNNVQKTIIKSSSDESILKKNPDETVTQTSSTILEPKKNVSVNPTPVSEDKITPPNKELETKPAIAPETISVSEDKTIPLSVENLAGAAILSVPNNKSTDNMSKIQTKSWFAKIINNAYSGIVETGHALGGIFSKISGWIY